MRVAILHNAVASDAGPDERDVLDQVEHVGRALDVLGHEVDVVACDLDLERLRRRLEARPPEVAFNLVESLGGHDRLLPLVPALLDVLGLPYTGTATAGLVTTTSKLLTKERLWAARFPAPSVLATWPEARLPVPETNGPVSDRVVLKSVWDHGSPALDDRAVVATASPAVLRNHLRELQPALGGAGFAEPYVEGREFNLSLLATGDGLVVLPAAEIDFVDYPADKPRIVGRDAKWSPGSFEYRHTPRRFDFSESDRRLLAELSRLARAAFRRVGMAGYGRVDFRVDGEGRPWILELNANPCLAPDAGFCAALAAAGTSFEAAVAHLLDDALRRSGLPRPRPVAVLTAGGRRSTHPVAV